MKIGAAIDDLSAAGHRGSPSVRSPSVLRETMAMDRNDQIGVELLDSIAFAWFAWRDAAAAMPCWSMFKPFAHARLLPHIMLYERIGDRYRSAIVGEMAAINLPMKLAGHFLDDVMPPENLADVTSRLDAALDSGLPNFVEKTMAWRIGYDLTSYRALQLPFDGQGGQYQRVLSVMNFRTEMATL